MHLPRNPDLTGVILVGGKSRRMGRDKAFLELAGKTLFERVLGLFRENFERILLVGNHADRFSAYGLPVIPDIYSGSSLGGIYTGLHQSETEYVFVASCDLPFPNGEILRYLIDQRRGYDAVVATTANGYEPLFALYSKSCLEPIKSLIESGDYCAYAYFDQVRVRYVPYEELSHLDRDRNAFVNVNTPEEFERIGGQIMTVKAVSFVAKSGTGKTTLLEKVIACLKERGYRVGVIKHDAHRFDIDHPGKDSYRLAAAGADTMLISSPEKLALVKKHDSSPPIENLISTYFTDVDIVLTEGFKKSSMPKIELHRKERSPVLLCRGEESDPSLIAVASDESLDLDVPLLDLNNPCEVADFIEVRFLR